MSEEKKLTGYPSIDKPWLKYYTEEQKNAVCPNMTAYDYLKHCNQANLNRTAIRSIEGSYSYCELFIQIEKTAGALLSHGFERGNIVLAMLPTISYEVFLFYGADAAGGAISYIVPGTTVEEICKIIKELDVNFLFVLDSFLTDELERAVYFETKLNHLIVIGNSNITFNDNRTLGWDMFISACNDQQLVSEKKRPEEMVFLAKTGGSTGKPKHVMLSGNAINESVHKIYISQKYGRDDKWIRLWPLFSSSAAVATSHLPLCAGYENILCILSENFDGFDRLLLTEKPNHFTAIPQLFDTLEKSELLQNEDLSFIKTFGCGGMALTAEYEHRVHNFFDKHNISAFIGHGWGCTESAVDGSGRISKETEKHGTVGVPFMNTVVAAFDPNAMTEKQYGEEGELCIQSNSLMMGYYNAHELTRKVLKQHTDGKTWLHTGDLGYIVEDGFVTVSGRMTRTAFVYPNAKIYPNAIEEEISQVEGVLLIAVGVVPDSKHDGCVKTVCFVVPKEGYDARFVQQNVENFCIKNYLENVRPIKIYITDKLPTTPVGKIDYLALEKEAEKS